MWVLIDFIEILLSTYHCGRRATYLSLPQDIARPLCGSNIADVALSYITQEQYTVLTPATNALSLPLSSWTCHFVYNVVNEEL